MIFIPVRGVFENDKLIFKLNKPFKSCLIGLLDFNLPKVDSRPSVENTIDLTCDQIDSNFFNPKRILKRLCFNRVDKYDYYNRWQANIIEYHNLDSDENILTFHLCRTIFGPNKDGSIAYHNYNGYDKHESFFTIVIKPMDSNDRWLCA